MHSCRSQSVILGDIATACLPQWHNIPLRKAWKGVLSQGQSPLLVFLVLEGAHRPVRSAPSRKISRLLEVGGKCIPTPQMHLPRHIIASACCSAPDSQQTLAMRNKVRQKDREGGPFSRSGPPSSLSGALILLWKPSLSETCLKFGRSPETRQ